MIIKRTNTLLLFLVLLAVSCSQQKGEADNKSDQEFTEYWDWISTHEANFSYRKNKPVGNEPEAAPYKWAVYMDSIEYLVPVGSFKATAQFPLDLILFRPYSDYSSVEFRFMLASYKAGELFKMVNVVSGEVGWDCKVPNAELVVIDLRPVIRFSREACEDSVNPALIVEWLISNTGEVNSTLQANNPLSEDQPDVDEHVATALDERSFSGNFALLWQTEENPELLNWDASLVNGARWGGERVLFFDSKQEVFGHAIGFDMDTHRLKGKFEIASQTQGATGLIVEIILSVEDVLSVEGEGEIDRRQIENAKLQIQVMEDKVILSGFPWVGGGEQFTATFKNLSREEIDQARNGLDKF